MSGTRRSSRGMLLAIGCLVVLGSMAARGGSAPPAVAVAGGWGSPLGGAEDLSAACGSVSPFLAATRLLDNAHGKDPGARPVVLAFRDTAPDLPAEMVPLGTDAQVGAAYGLAFDSAHGALYVATFVRRGALLPAGGPGAIERIDLASGAVTRWADLAAGPADIHRLSISEDEAGAAWVGRAGLGDIDMDPAGSSLFVADLYDGRIWRLAVPEGTVLGSFANGGAGQAWGPGARPFGLAVRGDRVFHGLVESVGASPGITVPVAHVYSSLYDGSALREVATFALDPPDPGTGFRWAAEDRPVISDIDFRDDGSMLVAVRNLAVDAQWEVPARLGDLIPAVPDGELWRGLVTPELYDDLLAGRDEALTGGIAVLPGLDLVVAAGVTATGISDQAAAAWYDGATGGLARVHQLDVPGDDFANPALPGVGDIEVLCAPDTQLDPARVATATARSAQEATGTAAAVATAAVARATALPATMTVQAPTLAAYRPTQAALATGAAGQTVPAARATAAAADFLQVTAACDTDDPYYAVAHEHGVRRSVVGLPRTAVTAFNKSSPTIAIASSSETGSVYGLAYDGSRAELYVSAFDPALDGPSGKGAIYRLELATGRSAPWAVLPMPRAVRQAAFYEAGIGDIDLDDGATQLFAVNLSDRAIYRLSVPDGELLGAIPNGAGAEPWAAQAYPFALAYHDGWLYQGVVPDLTRVRARREAVIYRSRPDGTEMEEVARFGLNYSIPSIPLGLRSTGLVADIAFRRGGAAVIGLRQGVSATAGDLLPLLPGRPSWVVATNEDLYVDRGVVTGGLAESPVRDQVVAAAVVGRNTSVGALWLDNNSGSTVDRRVLVPGGISVRCDPFGKCEQFADYELLGDLEALCPVTVPTPTLAPTPTASPSPTPRPSPTNTPSPTPTSTATRTPTATPTPVPRPLYLPLVLAESCHERKVHADVSLVIDASTSMRNRTRDGRPKLDAVQDAARTFVDLMDLAPEGGNDQVALVAFNSRAWVVAALASDAAALHAAIDSLPDGVSPGTRLDLALDVGHQALEAPSRMVANTPVVVLLTDGLPNGVPLGPGGTQEETVLAAAERTKSADVRVFTIGVGLPDAADPADRINADLLRAVASSPDMFFQTVDAAELERIYSEIAYTLGCPPEAFWGGHR